MAPEIRWFAVPRKAETATRLEAFLAGVDDPERLVEIGDLASADGEKFLSRSAGSVRRH